MTDIEWMRVHVQELKTNMEDIRFTEPEFSAVDNEL